MTSTDISLQRDQRHNVGIFIDIEFVEGIIGLIVSYMVRVFRNKSPYSSSKRGRVRTDMKLISMVVCIAEETVHLARLQAV
jgi:hypothetical protein